MKPKREAILRMVLDFLTNEKHEKLTISNIANALDIGKSTVYEYFDEKDAMVAEAVAMAIDEQVRYLLDVEGFDELNYDDAIRTHMRRSFHLARENKTFEKMMHNVDFVTISADYRAQIERKVFEVYQTLHEHVMTILRKGIDEGLLGEAVSEHRLHVIESLLIGSVFAVTNPLANPDIAAFIDEIAHCVTQLHQ